MSGGNTEISIDNAISSQYWKVKNLINDLVASKLEEKHKRKRKLNVIFGKFGQSSNVGVVDLLEEISREHLHHHSSMCIF